ncbi:MAG: amino acid permease [Bacteroidota bacterium]|nr:amino acid permease [Bacteroidota bacterium]
MKKSVGVYTAISIVIANMIGTGVFTSIGFQVIDIHSVFSIMLLWVAGGVIALSGALTYGELAARMPHSGGEYYYLSRIYHPSIGFLSGWISLLVGFAAPVALASIAFSKYLSSVFPLIHGYHIENHVAAGIILLLTSIHAYNVKAGSYFQVSFTSIKIILISIFILSAFIIGGDRQTISIIPKMVDWKEIISPAFAVSLVFVTYAYSGWNASVYIASEINNPKKNVPKSLLIGTAVVLLCYVLLNYVFLYTSPMSQLAGQVEVGYISATNIFGNLGGRLMGLIISLLLISTMSAMIFAGPRVIKVMGEDMKAFRFFSYQNNNGAPVYAILLQCIITLIFIYTSSFESVLTYTGFTLNLFTFLTVAGIFVLRYRDKKNNVDDSKLTYKTWGYPFVPIIFLVISLWILVFLMKEKTTESLLGLATVLSGFIFYYLTTKFETDKKKFETNDEEN